MSSIPGGDVTRTVCYIKHMLLATGRLMYDTVACWSIYCTVYRDQFVHALSQWETALHCNVASHWLGGTHKMISEYVIKNYAHDAHFVMFCLCGSVSINFIHIFQDYFTGKWDIRLKQPWRIWVNLSYYFGFVVFYYNWTCHPDSHYCSYYPGALYLYQAIVTHLSPEDQAPVDETYGCLVFKWVAETWLQGRLSG